MAEKTYKRPTRYEVDNLRRLNEAQSHALAQARERVAQLEAALRAVSQSIESSMGEDAEPWLTFIEDELKE